MHSHQQGFSFNQFYQKVIEDFGKKLFEKCNQQQQGFDSQMIDQIKRRIKDKMEHPEEMFHKALKIKHGASGQLVIDKQTSQVKRQQVQAPESQDDDVYQNVFGPQAQVKKKKVQAPRNSNNLNQKIQQSLEKGQKVQQLVQNERKGLKEKDKQRTQKINKIKNSLQIHIVGTYQRKKKKYVSKDKSIKLDIENVFIKCRNTREEIFVPKLQCKFRKQ